MVRLIPPRAAVIGTGRSGTGYMAALLNAAGAKTGHEQWWHSHWGERASGLDVDVSWLALPLIETRAWSGPVLHVVRHPVDVVRSMMGTLFFHDSEAREPYPMYARAHCPRVVGLPPLHAAVEWWCDWNARCAAVADATIRVEDITTTDTARETIRDVLGVTVHAETAASVPTDMNTRTRGNVDPTAVWRLVGARAHGYGYGA